MDFQAKYEELKLIVRSIGAVFRFDNYIIDQRSLFAVNMAFSSSGEDLWLRQYMKTVLRSGKPGFYVDLGCNEPVITSNSYLFYGYGWHGICIDANRRFFSDFEALRPRDILVQAAISDQNQSLYFAEYRGTHKMARVMASPADFDDMFFPPVEVKARRLDDVLREHVPSGTVIDFMSVDLEDSELPALRSNDWSTYRPRVILIEAGTGFDPLSPLNFPTIGFLHQLGYKYQGSASNNVLMTSPDF
jgi:FkbM family methyltransferase